MKIAQLNFDSFKINGQLNERAPRVIDNIYKNFPLDNNSSNSLPICILSVNNKELFASDPSLIESKNRLIFTSFNSGEDGILYFCAINESTNKICVILKIDKSGGSYYETDYTTDFGNIRYRKSSGC